MSYYGVSRPDFQELPAGASLPQGPIAYAVSSFKEITRRYALFHISFFLVSCLELFAFVLFFSFLTRSTILAFSIAGLVLTGFAYFVILFYLQAKKPEQIEKINADFVAACQSVALEETHYEASFFESKSRDLASQRLLSLSQALQQLLAHLHRLEYSYYSPPVFLQSLAPLMEKFSAWCHWQDLHQMKEKVMQQVLLAQVELVKKFPTHPPAHLGLADAYVCLARLYRDPRKNPGGEELVWVAPEYFSPSMQQQSQSALHKAIQEFRILHQYMPHDPGVLAQLIMVYEMAEMPKEEIAACEALLRITPEAPALFLRLGILYFQQDLPAQALALYEKLQIARDSRAEELISHYL